MVDSLELCPEMLGEGHAISCRNGRRVGNGMIKRKTYLTMEASAYNTEEHADSEKLQQRHQHGLQGQGDW